LIEHVRLNLTLSRVPFCAREGRSSFVGFYIAVHRKFSR
jgi:hypothetical protein